MLTRLLRNKLDPKTKADQLLNKLPATNTLRNTTTFTLLASATAFAVSKELYVFTEDSILLASFATIIAIMYKQGKPAYLETADAYISNMKKLFTSARENHSKLVSNQVEERGKLSNIVNETKSLFQLSKEMVDLQKQEFELKQQIELTQMIKQKLDAWNRFESSIAEGEKQRMLSNVMNRVDSELAKKEVQNQLFQQALRDLDLVKMK
eukprot:NODE_1134_length_2061_cov_0.390928.p2 type:complete len:209 gc:universal NODE_1134_length_2061_cov_0.390928:1541-915(-)